MFQNTRMTIQNVALDLEMKVGIAAQYIKDFGAQCKSNIKPYKSLTIEAGVCAVREVNKRQDFFLFPKSSSFDTIRNGKIDRDLFQ
jgi:hypothetical protein